MESRDLQLACLELNKKYIFIGRIHVISTTNDERINERWKSNKNTETDRVNKTNVNIFYFEFQFLVEIVSKQWNVNILGG